MYQSYEEHIHALQEELQVAKKIVNIVENWCIINSSDQLYSAGASEVIRMINRYRRNVPES
jgi:hypothetical protein